VRGKGGPHRATTQRSRLPRSAARPTIDCACGAPCDWRAAWADQDQTLSLILKGRRSWAVRGHSPAAVAFAERQSRSFSRLHRPARHSEHGQGSHPRPLHLPGSPSVLGTNRCAGPGQSEALRNRRGSLTLVDGHWQTVVASANRCALGGPSSLTRRPASMETNKRRPRETARRLIARGVPRDVSNSTSKVEPAPHCATGERPLPALWDPAPLRCRPATLESGRGMQDKSSPALEQHKSPREVLLRLVRVIPSCGPGVPHVQSGLPAREGVLVRPI
jgi:hypothetical protein